MNSFPVRDTAEPRDTTPPPKVPPPALMVMEELAKLALDTTPEFVIPAKLALPESEREVPCASAKRKSRKEDEAVVEVAFNTPAQTCPMVEEDTVRVPDTCKVVEVA